ncbi:MAG: radical SAM protein [Candidatus Omnitrophica bacterium]|nr:radical SAM protein [Candidatus Omnitrophota bacterium]
MKYIYGPVKSRRLGLSLGLSLTPYKICDFDCIYCQLGKTVDLTPQRQEFIKIEDILNEFKSWLQNNPGGAKELDYVTISGSGEPTLNIKIGELIREIKKSASCRIAVITNASLLSDPQLRLELKTADLIVPSLDTVIPEIFQQIDRPHQNIKIGQVIDGLVSLRKEFSGKIWLEIMLVAGVNDDLRQIRKLKEVVDRINPDKIQLNSPVRSTCEPGLLPVDKGKLDKIRGILGEKCEII